MQKTWGAKLYIFRVNVRFATVQDRNLGTTINDNSTCDNNTKSLVT